MQEHYMESKKKIKLILKPEYYEAVRDVYPDAFDTNERTVKISYAKDHFYKSMQLEHEILKNLLKDLWITYYGYFQVVLHSMNYDNIIDFRSLTRLWFKKWMIDLCKRKFSGLNMVRKYEWDWYVNPSIAVKWEHINPDLTKLFE